MTDSCLAIGPETIKVICEEAGLKVSIPNTGNDSEKILVHNLQAVENSDAVIFGTGRKLGELSSTSTWLLGYAVAKGKTIIGWLNEEEDQAIISWKDSHPMIIESAYIVTSDKALIHAIITIRDAGREMAEIVKKKARNFQSDPWSKSLRCYR